MTVCDLRDLLLDDEVSLWTEILTKYIKMPGYLDEYLLRNKIELPDDSVNLAWTID